MLENQELKKIIDTMTARKDKLENNLLELSIYSNGSLTPNDLYNMPLSKIETIQKSLISKIELDLGINSKKYL